MSKSLSTTLAIVFGFAIMAIHTSTAHAATYAVGQRVECDPMSQNKYYQSGVVIAFHPGETYNGYTAGSGYFYRVRMDGGDADGMLCKADNTRLAAATSVRQPSIGGGSSAIPAAPASGARTMTGGRLPQASGGARFGTREARKCAPQKTQPNVEQIKAILQCYDESQSTRDLMYLDENMSIQAGAPRRFIEFSDNGSTGIDTTAPVIPIRGSLDSYQCAPLSKYTNVGTTYDTDNTGKNCAVAPVRNRTGTCWRTTFGDWECRLNEAMSGTESHLNQSPPRR
jgi:hypothetical protein